LKIQLAAMLHYSCAVEGSEKRSVDRYLVATAYIRGHLGGCRGLDYPFGTRDQKAAKCATITGVSWATKEKVRKKVTYISSSMRLELLVLNLSRR